MVSSGGSLHLAKTKAETTVLVAGSYGDDGGFKAQLNACIHALTHTDCMQVTRLSSSQARVPSISLK
jgi:hypothetical protein